MKGYLLKVKITYTEELLGTAPADPEVYDKYIASLAPDAATREQEVAELGIEEVQDKGMTVFPRLEDGTPYHMDYQWKGFMKDACGMLNRTDFAKSKELRAYKKIIDGSIFVFGSRGRKIPLQLPAGGMIGFCQRSLRADTPKGSRTALACSETVPAGTTEELAIVFLNKTLLKYILEWFDYAALRGTGQWRNAGNGTFKVEYPDGTKPIECDATEIALQHASMA